MSRRAPMDVVTGLRNTRRSMGDGTLQGRVRNATPYERGSARKVPPAQVIVPTSVTANGRFVRFTIEPGAAVDVLAFGDAENDEGWGHAAGDALVIPVGRSYYALRECKLLVDHRGWVSCWAEINGERVWPSGELDDVWLGGDGVPLHLDLATGPVSEADEVTLHFDPPIDVVKGRAVMELVDRQAGSPPPPPYDIPDSWDTTSKLGYNGPSVPSNTEPGDLLLVAFADRYNTGNTPKPEGPGWTEILWRTHGVYLAGSQGRVSVLAKVADTEEPWDPTGIIYDAYSRWLCLRVPQATLVQHDSIGGSTDAGVPTPQDVTLDGVEGSNLLIGVAIATSTEDRADPVGGQLITGAGSTPDAWLMFCHFGVGSETVEVEYEDPSNSNVQDAVWALAALEISG